MIGHVIYTYNRLDDARILQEIVKNGLSTVLGDVFLIHAYNGEKSFGYQKYLEDVLIQTKNAGHFQGACDLINRGVKEAQKHRGIEYLIVTASDTWPLNFDYVKHIIDTMRERQQAIAVCAWDDRGIENHDPDFSMNLFRLGFSTDFFILDMNWQREHQLFPLDFKAVAKQFNDTKIFLTGNIVYLEDVIAYSYAQIFVKKYSGSPKYKKEMLDRIYHLKEREPIHTRQSDGFWKRTMAWEDFGLYTYHDDAIQGKQEALLKHSQLSGPHIDKLRHAENLTYFNVIETK